MATKTVNPIRHVEGICPHSINRVRFLRFLSLDLRRIGIRPELSLNSRRIRFRAKLTDIGEKQLRHFFREECGRRLTDQHLFLQQMIASGVLREFTEISQLNIDAISPRIQLCTTRHDADIFKFVRLMQSVPAPPLLYRQVPVIVRDDGQPGSPIMGVFGLTSGVYSLAGRDEFLGWVGKNAEVRKKRGLKQIMHLAICMATPPYHHLRAARLLAALAATREIAEEYRRRYVPRNGRDRLLALVTTSATGIHAPIFNRLMLRPGGLYRRVGETTGYSAVFFSRDTIAAARQLVVHVDSKSPEYRAIRTLKRAFSICGIPREPLLRLCTPKGVYVALLGHQALTGLRGRTRCDEPDYLCTDEVIEYWKKRDLPKALEKIDRLGKGVLADVVA